jgi:cellulose synthase/poly-beta-1,6-N-acetylglucosamine synthase-like glycosyltransferase
MPDWPRDRLDIKLVLEEDDIETRAEVERYLPGPPFDVIVVPRIGPRTKPKALAFAHLFSRGAFVTVYDAEDDPHPRQLREAFARFRAEPELACVQAPLLIDNPDPTWIARLFAIEYSALFDGLLPYLASKGLPLPLGGTSNHFRRAALDEIGGWDPFNVTEDADIGLRLARGGYRVGTITLPTYEEAPVSFGAWMRQRSRWFKGWMQTCLVHTRQPLRLARDLGLKRTIGFAAIQLGMVFSALLHPFFIVLLIAFVAEPSAILARADGVLVATLAAIGLLNLFAGYAAMTTLASRTLPLRGLRRIETALIWLPLYWLLMSVAIYRAFFQLLLRPHYWDKTTHLGFVSRVKPQRWRGALLQPAHSGMH